MAYIIQGFGSDQRIQLGAEEIVRPMYWGSNWTKIRIGMRMNIGASADLAFGTFTVGVCLGNIGFCSPNTVDAVVGAPCNGIASLRTATWNYSASGYISYANGGITAIRKVGQVLTNNATISSNFVYCAAQPNIGSVRSNYYIDVLKSGTSVLISQWACTTVSAQVDCARDYYLYQLENELSPRGPGGNGSSNVNATVVPSNPSSSYLWDNICIGWSRSIPTIELCDVTVLRFF